MARCFPRNWHRVKTCFKDLRAGIAYLSGAPGPFLWFHDGFFAQDRGCLPFWNTWSHFCFVKEFMDSMTLFLLFSFYLLVCFKFVLSLWTVQFDLECRYSTLGLFKIDKVVFWHHKVNDSDGEPKIPGGVRQSNLQTCLRRHLLQS